MLAAFFAVKCGIFQAPSIWTFEPFFSSNFFRPSTVHSFYCVPLEGRCIISQDFVDIDIVPPWPRP